MNYDFRELKETDKLSIEKANAFFKGILDCEDSDFIKFISNARVKSLLDSYFELRLCAVFKGLFSSPLCVMDRNVFLLYYKLSFCASFACLCVSRIMQVCTLFHSNHEALKEMLCNYEKNDWIMDLYLQGSSSICLFYQSMLDKFVSGEKSGKSVQLDFASLKWSFKSVGFLIEFSDNFGQILFMQSKLIKIIAGLYDYCDELKSSLIEFLHGLCKKVFYEPIQNDLNVCKSFALFLNEHISTSFLSKYCAEYEIIDLIESLKREKKRSEFEPIICVLKEGEEDFMNKAAQVCEMFPEFSKAAIANVLKRNDGNVDRVISMILEGSIAEELSRISLYSLEERKNIHDNDNFDVIKNTEANPNMIQETVIQDIPLSDAIKTRILDMQYEDEYDDSFEAFSSTTIPSAEGAIEIQEENPIEANIAHLYKAYVECPEALERTSQARRSAERKALCKQTSLTNGQIEGWFVMFCRNPKKDEILQDWIMSPANRGEIQTKSEVTTATKNKKKNHHRKDRAFRKNNIQLAE